MLANRCSVLVITQEEKCLHKPFSALQSVQHIFPGGGRKFSSAPPAPPWLRAWLRMCSRCENVVSLNVFKTGINAASFLPVFKAVFLVFLTGKWRLRHTGTSGFARVFDYDLHRRTRACLLCTLVPPTTDSLNRYSPSCPLQLSIF